MSDVVARAVSWLWLGRFPLGKLVVVDGDPGLGKTTMLLDVAARVTTSAPMPDGTRSDIDGPAGVVILSAEDGLDDTIRPRLDAAGADVSRVVALVGVRSDDDHRSERLPTLADIEAIRSAIASVGARLVIIDPFMAYLPGRVDSKSDQDVRSLLSRLARLAEEAGVTIALIRHLNKAQGLSVLYRGGGSIGIIGAARSGLLVAPDPDDGSRRILAVTKANLAAPVPALAYRLVTDGATVRVAWEGPTDHTADRLLSEPQAHEERSATADAVDWLRDALADGPRTARDVESDAARADVSRKVLRTAREKLGVKPKREGFGPGSRVVWALPTASIDAQHVPIEDIDARSPDGGIYGEYGDSRASMVPTTESTNDDTSWFGVWPDAPEPEHVEMPADGDPIPAWARV